MKILKQLLIIFFLGLLLFSCNKEKEYTVEDMYKAAENDNIEVLQSCLDQGLDINTIDKTDWLESGWSVLDAAISRSNSIDTIKFLLNSGANPQNIKVRNKRTKSDFLTFSTLQGLNSTAIEPEYTELLLSYGSNPNLFGHDEVSILMRYIQSLSKVKEYQNEILQSMRLLLEYGADPNYRGPNSGMTALLVALNYELRDAVDLLMEYGAEPSLKPTKAIFNYDPLNFKKYDENHGVTWQSELHLFAANGYADLLMPYIESGQADPYTKMPNGWDMFFYAVQGGHADMVEALLPYIKDINSMFYDYMSTTDTGVIRWAHRSLLMVAVENEIDYGEKLEHIEIAKLLLEYGIDPNLVGIDLGSMWVTAKNNYKSSEMFDLLISHDAHKAEYLPGYEEHHYKNGVFDPG